MVSKEKKRGYERFLNQKVKIVYLDEVNPIAKEGILISVSDDALIIFVTASQKEVLIPKSRIVKIEVKNGNK